MPCPKEVGLNLWFFIGDTITWLQSRRATGVHKVTLELFSTAVREYADDKQTRIIPCALADTADGLVMLAADEASAFFSRAIDEEWIPVPANGPDTPSIVVERSMAPNPLPEPSGPCWPRQGDEVLFTGAVWTPIYTSLFRELRGRNVNINVLVYDIIPIERPDFVSDLHYKMFLEWLKAVTSLANIIFVSSLLTKQKIVRWATENGIPITARIETISFGTLMLEPFASLQEMRINPLTSTVRLDDFALSVGTIDRRKNQALLLKIWARLVAELGASSVPQLVLAGRNELEGIDSKTADLLRNGHATILSGATDRIIGGLYRSCLFTIFPSLSEGYGIPVAESLSAGKLCLASDLPVIREFAASLVWYFDPEDETSAYEVVREAIERADRRALAEQLIRERFTPAPWAATLRSMTDAMAAKISSIRFRPNRQSIE